MAGKSPMLTHRLAALFFAVSIIFVYRSFFGMRIRSGQPGKAPAHAPAD
jgi:K(+)-stimulated pyrophosphate-energized sodium pump